MNFLAHFYLAYGDEDRLVGQFVADAIKGNDYLEFEGNIREGIKQHRFIDTTTDSHHGSSQLRSLLRPKVGLLSPIAVDILFDYALATRWQEFHNLPLEKFAEQVYITLAKNNHFLPERMQITLHYMAKYDWLSGYQYKHGIINSLKGLSQRVSRGEKLLAAIDMFDEIENDIFENFDLVFKDLTDGVKTLILDSNSTYLSPNHHY
ncbi:MAG: ACP phosphodiesterase [Flavobacteriales bacterium]